MVDKKEETKTKEENDPVNEENSKPLKKGFITGTGRRKTSVARVFLWETKGDFIVNGMKIEEYFPDEIDRIKWEKPFHTIGVSHPEAKFSASIKTSGSGKSSQLDAIVLGISRALSKIDDEYSKSLRKQGFLTRDPRMVERKKPYLRKARKRPQYSKR
jgi:small subunit ribosomal protein S9